MPIASKEAKASDKASLQRAILRSFSFGVVTNRDDWVYGEGEGEVAAKVRHLIAEYNADVKRLAGASASAVASLLGDGIKWTRAVKRDLLAGRVYAFDAARITTALYRPFGKRLLYFSPQLNEMPNLMPKFFGADGKHRTRAIVFTDPTSQKPFMTCAVDVCPDMHFVGAAAGAVVLPEQAVGDTLAANVTDWSLDQFKKHYQPGRGKQARPITKEAIFHYVYGVLHDPVYREKYALNLKREFPRIPFYADFWQWSDWGRALMDLHIGYEQVPPFALTRTDVPDEKARRAGQPPKTVLRADPAAGRIVLDSETVLAGVPAEAWDYKLGNRSALDWVLDQHKEKTPRDPTIREKFNTYRFADYKDKAIDLLARVTTVSVETMKIIAAMRQAGR